MLKYFEALDEGDQRQVIGVAQGMVLSAAQKDRPSYGPTSGSGAKVV
jgi:hypothetical protein